MAHFEPFPPRMGCWRVVEQHPTPDGLAYEGTIEPIRWHPGYWLHVARCVALTIRDLLRGREW